MADKATKGRTNMPTGAEWFRIHDQHIKQQRGKKYRTGNQRRGEAAPFAKLTESEVRQIKMAWLEATKKYGLQRRLATQYQVDRLTILAICNGKTWKHVEVSQ